MEALAILLGMVLLGLFIIAIAKAGHNEEPQPEKVEDFPYSQNQAKFKIAGINFRKGLEPDEELGCYVSAEKDNEHDPYCIRIVGATGPNKGKLLGYVPKGNQYLHQYLTASGPIKARAMIYEGDDDDKPYLYGFVCISLVAYDDINKDNLFNIWN